MNVLLLLAACDGGPTPADTGNDSGVAPAVCDDASGNICTWAGTGDAGYFGEGGDRRDAWFYFPTDIEVSPLGNPIIQDWNNHKIRMVKPDDTVVTIMGTDFIGDGPPDGSDKTAPGAPGTSVNLNHPTDAVYFPDGTLLSASWHTHKIRTWDPATGLVMVHCGATPGFVGDNGESATGMLMNQPKAVEIAEDGTIYILDMRNQRVRALSPDFTIRTLAGNGTKGYAGDGDLLTNVNFAFPSGTNPRPGGALALADGILYVSDTENYRIRAINLLAGTISTVVGNGTAGFSGDDGLASAAQINYVTDIEVVGGKMYIADTDNDRVRVVDLATGMISTIVGNGTPDYTGDGGPALEASLHHPYGLDVDEDGTLYIADTYNHVIRVVYP